MTTLADRLTKIRALEGELPRKAAPIINNAIKVSPKKGTIRIETRPTEDGVRLIFQDDGPGIPEAVQSRIFDPFFTTKPIGVGTGLGLSLSHGIIERHDGRISVDSAPGRGVINWIRRSTSSLDRRSTSASSGP